MMQHALKDADVTITHYQGMEGLESLREAWNEIVFGMARRHFFHLWEWHHSYLKCLETDTQSFLYFLFAKGKTPVAIIPLRFTKISLVGMQLKTLALPSHKHLLLNDFICHGDVLSLPLFQLLSGYLRDQNISWDLIQLTRLLEDACAIRVIREQSPKRFILRYDGRCDFMDTTGEYQSFVSGLSKNFKRSLKRGRQYLNQLPGVEFTFTHNDPELDEKLDAFMDVEASGWKGALGSGTAIILHPSLRCFYRELTHSLASIGRVSVNTLTTDGKCIAAQFCILLDNTVYVLKVGYDEAYKRYAPGNLLLDLLMKRSIEDCTIESINLCTDTEWHLDWRPKSYDRSTLYLFNATPAGLLGFAILKFIQIFKKHYHAYIQPHLTKRIQEWIVSLSHET